MLRGVTPPEGTFLLRVPVGHADGFANALSALPDEERSAFTRVESKKGQTFASIGTRAGVSAKHLAWYNPNVTTTKKGALHAGQVVRIPTHAVLAAAVEVPDPGIERYGSSRTARLHTVKSGETLSSIASRYGTTVPALMRANRLRKKVIVPGQQIAVRGTAPSSRTSSVKSTGTRRKSPAKHASASRSSSRLKSKAKPAKHPAKGHRA